MKSAFRQILIIAFLFSGGAVWAKNPISSMAKYYSEADTVLVYLKRGKEVSGLRLANSVTLNLDSKGVSENLKFMNEDWLVVKYPGYFPTDNLKTTLSSLNLIIDVTDEQRKALDLGTEEINKLAEPTSDSSFVQVLYLKNREHSHFLIQKMVLEDLPTFLHFLVSRKVASLRLTQRKYALAFFLTIPHKDNEFSACRIWNSLVCDYVCDIVRIKGTVSNTDLEVNDASGEYDKSRNKLTIELRYNNNGHGGEEVIVEQKNNKTSISHKEWSVDFARGKEVSTNILEHCEFVGKRLVFTPRAVHDGDPDWTDFGTFNGDCEPCQVDIQSYIQKRRFSYENFNRPSR